MLGLPEDNVQLEIGMKSFDRSYLLQKVLILIREHSDSHVQTKVRLSSWELYLEESVMNLPNLGSA